MPTRLAQPFLFLLAKASHRRHAENLNFVREENRVLRALLPEHLTIPVKHRKRLIKFGKPLGPDLRHIITIVSYSTFLQWKRDEEEKEKKDKSPKTSAKNAGRPKVEEDIESTVLRLARENSWGYTRILGELKKLGISASRSTVRRILQRHYLDPGPVRGPGSWSEFIKRHAQTLWACDFLSKKIITKLGWLDCFVFFLIHIESRRVHLAGVTVDPSAEWMANQARALRMMFEEQPQPQNGKPVILLRDGDDKYTPQFNRILKDGGIKVKPLPFHSPNLNAFAERWVQSFRVECLDHFLVFGEEHMRVIAQNYEIYYNQFRPHQSKDNQPLAAKPPPTAVEQKQPVQCQTWLGGLLRHYYRAAG